MTSCEKKKLNDICKVLRKDIVDMIFRAGSGHPGGSLSAVEIVALLYFKIMNIDPKIPDKQDRDRFIMSKGHAAPILYAALARKGYFSTDELFTLRQLGSILQGHPDMKKTPGVDFSSGSLGHGLSIGCGMALGSRYSGITNRIYVLLGDGELNEGQVWEAAMLAAKYNLENITAVVDRNCVQLDGTSKCIMPMEPLADKWRAFGWNVIAADGHDVENLDNAFSKAQQDQNRPSVIVARTVKGKGISFMEGKYQWHGGRIDDETYSNACREIGCERGGKDE